MPVQKQGSIIGCKCTSTLRREEIMNYIGKYLGDLGGLTNKYSSTLMTVGIVFALLNCFFGYKLRKVWITLAGAAAGGAAGYYFLKDVKLSAAIAAGGAILLAVFAFQIYRLGLFVLCGGLTYWMLGQLFSADTSMARGICIVAGVVVGVLALQYERIIVILTTGICGGFGASRLLFTMTGREAGILAVLVGLILAALGILFQYQLGTKRGKEEFEKDSQSLFHRDGKSRGRSRRKKRSLRDYLPTRRKKKKKKRGKADTSENVQTSTSRQSRGTGGTKKKSGTNSERPQTSKRNKLNSEPEDERLEESCLSENRQDRIREGYENPLDMDEIAKMISKDVQKIYEDQEEK